MFTNLITTEVLFSKFKSLSLSLSLSEVCQMNEEIGPHSDWGVSTVCSEICRPESASPVGHVYSVL